ncbi:type II toxin-antitoxin system mRNA interferase toxin, RelE/StbE family [Candidatus Campbellbacteria bacterium CG10_big_fil_rev_8_21_14_0_10_35_52]|uniref:Type II toxin-antitoxin system mRNA interferase toxin, RelE/StbE family n=1 Tax=Candidatus Campbellbacteria bacterium CG10_big_fil_rev_8_21_14_0_10_35_52 TaxID=1974527 RepID=A0A2M6WVR3_9BACT|nr:MAG: type II toxin-antitoxin system mRNA interferase toxin, RelE/StbE family [Candidatus Campbellbacteria bacterium CG10_big_fil_rev_8_21_14_0_10_35_52]
MKIKISYSNQFIKDFKNTPFEIRVAFKERLEIFIKDKFNPTLNNRKLNGKLKNYRSINITGNWRAIFSENDKDEEIIFHLIGTHSKLYKK